jgi:gamma-glutamylcyclotransferase (GGCT)/AIG2-like uncharacterized protein YtfP
VRFDGSTYPGRPPGGPTLVLRGRSWPLRVTGDAAHPVAADVDALAAPVLAPGEVRWSLAYGANADADRLMDKGLDERGAVVLPASVVGWDRAWEARRTYSTGAVPLTLVRAPGRRLDVHAVGIHVDDTHALDRTEGRGERYRLARVGPVVVADRFLLDDGLAYGPGPSTRVLAVDDGPARFPAVSQSAAAALLDDGAPTVGADPLPRAVGAGWPGTPLRDLPLFVYGTLGPDGSRFAQVADLVDVAGPASIRGWLVATPAGYPAVDLTGAGEVHGALLRPTGPAAAGELFRRTDAIEGAPRLFRRRSVVARTAAGAGVWAAVYEWNPAQGPPPGEPVAGGRWAG